MGDVLLVLLVMSPMLVAILTIIGLAVRNLWKKD